EKKWWDNAHEAAFQSLQFKEEIVFAGRLQADELHRVISAAFALSFVPLFEGFGIPILEAFACGTPVITSNVTSMPEVAGDAALLANPYDVNDIASKMLELWKHPELRMQLKAKGLERRKDFSWEITANQLWACIEKTITE
ncbi:MAG: a-glycosyltransferase, glycosyltransferase family 4 protein, partial [Bacteroidota bacterium]